MRELKQDWRSIFCGFRIALDGKKMFLGFVAIVLSLVGLLLLVWAGQGLGALDAVTVDGPASLCKMLFTAPPNGWSALSREMVTAFYTTGLDLREVLFLVVAGLYLLVIWSIFGGAISRSAAVEFARDERIDLRESLSFAKSKFWSYVSSPVVPLIGIAIFMLCNNLGGLVGRIPGLGPLLVGLGFPLALLAGFLVALMTIGAVLGLPLMFPTISTEGTDAFDAISRAYSYVYSRPWRYIWYNLVACVYGAVVCCFVVAFAVLMVETTLGTVHFGMGDSAFQDIRINVESTYCGVREPLSAERAETVQSLAPWRWTVCGGLLKLWIGILVVGPLAGYVASYVLTAHTIVYFLMRKVVDGTDMTEVYVADEEEDFALPPAGPAGEAATEPMPAQAAPPEAQPDDAASGEDTAVKSEEEATPKTKKKKTTRKKTTRKKKAT